MDRYVSEAMELPLLEGRPDFSRADLVFEGVDHSGASFEARIFIGNADADETTPRDPAHGFAGAFTIFGHGGCAGDEGHCEVPEDQTDPEDQRLPHPLTPATKVVRITEALKRLSQSEFSITVVPVLPGRDGPRREDVLFFDSVELELY